ncbi:MAG TPA: dockerin type I repeat-containing protein, partial [Bacilli bacterium]|nr:dockerin type I repeat-containing protein [Bacilli bacterium]
YDGLFWASVGISITTPATPTESTYLTQFGLTKRSSYVTGVPLGTTVAQVKENVGTLTMTITNPSNVALTNGALISTGTKVTISDGTNTYSYVAVIYGDISGDGNINAVDLLNMRKHLLGTQKLTGASLEAAKIAKSSSLTAGDLLYLRRYLLDNNTYKIAQ